MPVRDFRGENHPGPPRPSPFKSVTTHCIIYTRDPDKTSRVETAQYLTPAPAARTGRGDQSGRVRKPFGIRIYDRRRPPREPGTGIDTEWEGRTYSAYSTENACRSPTKQFLRYGLYARGYGACRDRAGRIRNCRFITARRCVYYIELFRTVKRTRVGTRRRPGSKYYAGERYTFYVLKMCFVAAAFVVFFFLFHFIFLFLIYNSDTTLYVALYA